MNPRVRTAYLILAHDKPLHLGKLVAALSTPSAAILIHLDARADESRFRHVPAAHFCSPRVPVYWGEFSQVEAILLLLRHAVRLGCDRYVLLSGSDYPVQPVSYIRRFFQSRTATEFINIVSMPSREAGKPLSRLTEFRHRSDASPLRRALRSVLVWTRALPRERDPVRGLAGLQPFAGSTWWAITHAAAEFILHFTAVHPRIVRFFHNVDCPDEAFFQTILGNSPFRDRLQRNLTYADWSGGGDSPAYLDDRHLEMFRAPGPLVQSDVYGSGEYLFARKFSDAHPDVVDELATIIRSKGEPGGEMEP